MRNRGLIVLMGVLTLAAIVIYAIIGEPGRKVESAAPAESGEPTASVIINEVMASNSGAVPDEDGEFSDWLELYNPTDGAVNLSGWGLSDESGVAAKWAFPSVEIPAKGYLLVFCSGKNVSNANAAYQHTNFKLKAGVDSLALTNPSGREVDVMTLPQIASNCSIGRSPESGAWAEFKEPTPGFENSDQGRADYVASMSASDVGLLINEFQPSNQTTLTDGTGAYSDWIELYNPTEKDIDISGFGLTDDKQKPLKWRFPDGTKIAKGQYLIVFASGQTAPDGGLIAGQLHASFQLSAYQESVMLSNAQGRTIDSVDYREIPSDSSYGRAPDTGEWSVFAKPSPGYANTEEGYAQYQDSLAYGKSGLILSEAMLSNNAYAQEDDKQYYDWIELYNGTAETIDLSNYALSDNAKNPTKWRFPQTALKPGEYLVVMASGATSAGAKKKYLHTNFALSNKNGTVIVLADSSGKIVDRLNVSPLRGGMSYGRTDGKPMYYQTPTPGEKNSQGYRGFVPKPLISLAAGSYQGPQQVGVEVPDGAVVRYTVDGSIPTEQSPRYEGPVSVGKTAVVRVRAFESDLLPSETVTSTFVIDNPHSLPLISISTTPKNLFDPTTGIYMEGPNADPAKSMLGANYYNNTEVPASFEVYDESGKRVFNQDIALSMAGGLGLMKAQKTFAIHARSQYGQSTMKYPFFENRPYTEYKTLVLRTNRDKSKIREAVIFSLTDGKIKAMTQAYKPYVVYINGEYWGVYHMMEKRNKYMIAAYEGASDPDSINIQKGTKQLMKGSNESYVKLIDYVKTRDMSQKENFDYVAARLDTDSFMDVMINLIYTSNNDFYNMQSYQIPPDGKWKQIFYDVEITFQLPAHETLKARMGDTCNSDMFNALLKYKPWKDAFLERFAWTIKEIYNPQRVNAAIDEAAADIEGEIAAMRTKFGDTATVEEWNAQITQMHAFANQRPAAMVGQLKTVFTLSAAQIEMLDDAVK